MEKEQNKKVANEEIEEKTVKLEAEQFDEELPFDVDDFDDEEENINVEEENLRSIYQGVVLERNPGRNINGLFLDSNSELDKIFNKQSETQRIDKTFHDRVEYVAKYLSSLFDEIPGEELYGSLGCVTELDVIVREYLVEAKMFFYKAGFQKGAALMTETLTGEVYQRTC